MSNQLETVTNILEQAQASAGAGADALAVATARKAFQPEETECKPHLGKVAIVTGAAGGIGRATAERLYNDGAVVVGMDINPAITENLNQSGLSGVVCDITNDAAFQAEVDKVAAHAPGPGAAAYSVTKAGVTQLARVAALELAGDGVRVNTLHPDAVFDTEIWTQEALEKSAKRYGMTVEEYKTKNLLRTEIKSTDIARMISTVAGPVFKATTGAQIPIDGGNDRVI
eukprot:Seg14832.2 transcript_id=Seg14832.2/GoldUCD/mRNA.D3Y31 product="putative oxidoreductase YuxG" protein_id=Seg14832.2/GoldUCD/D3Y31